MAESDNSYEKSDKGTLIGTTIVSIQTRDREGLLQNLQQLNRQLTDGIKGGAFKDEETLGTDIDQLFESLEKSPDGDGEVTIYLGDGGYSRLNIGIDYDHKPFVMLSGSSTPQVKEKWQTIEKEYKNL